MTSRTPFVLALDIGGTKIACAIYDRNLNLVNAWKSPTKLRLSEIENDILSNCRRAFAEKKIEAIGVSVAGNVKPGGKVIAFSTNIPCWINYPMSSRLEAHFDVPIAIENDANAAGWAEFLQGSGRGSENMVMLTLGTGMGGALILNKKLYRGSFGMAGEIGHIPLVPFGLPCGCGLFGCAERYASGTAIENFAKQAVRANPVAGSRLLELAMGERENIVGPMVFQAASEGDELCKGVYYNVGKWLGKTMASVSAILDPDVFVLGGSAASRMLLSGAESAYCEFLQASSFRPHAEIKLAKFGGDAGMRGAALLALEKMEK